MALLGVAVSGLLVSDHGGIVAIVNIVLSPCDKRIPVQVNSLLPSTLLIQSVMLKEMCSNSSRNTPSDVEGLLP